MSIGHSPPCTQGGARGGLASTGNDSSANAPTPNPSLRAGRGVLQRGLIP
jgi:hypothetical protein